MSEPVIEARGLGKAFERQANPVKAFARVMAGGALRDPFWALREVSLALHRGQSLGIVGRNGSGKSTLLQLICGTLSPSTGTVTVKGRVAAMLELGAGFHPDFTGRENALLAAGVYGLTGEQIVERLPAIEAFADIGAYIDRPVREYSSGMYARLAFAVCAHVDADILVVDEILGVGDAAFQRKCHHFMASFREKGTLLFVSHDPGAVLASCEEALWLEGARVESHGPAKAVLERYVASQALDASQPQLRRSVAVRARADQPDLRPTGPNFIDAGTFNRNCASHGTGQARIVDCAFIDAQGQPCTRLTGGDLVRLRIRVEVSGVLESPIVGFMFRNAAGQNLFGDNTFNSFREQPLRIEAGRVFEAQLAFRMPLLPRGSYSLAPSVLSGTQQQHVHVNWLEDALVLKVGDGVRHGRVGVHVTGATLKACMQEFAATSPA